MSETVTCASCVNLDKDGWCEKIADSPHPDAERYCDYHQTSTNGDRIRRMTDDKLAALLCDISSQQEEGHCELCIAAPYCRAGHDGFLDWLKEESNGQK